MSETEATITLSLTVNGNKIERRGVPAELRLIDFLHEELGLTGTKYGCGIGRCRACTVAVERTPGAPLRTLRSCMASIGSVNHQAITTVEGLARGEAGDPAGLHPLQRAFLDEFAFQCGYSTPGYLMAAFVLLDELKRRPVPRDQIEGIIHRAVGKHVCRCTGYLRYYAAIRKVILATPGMVQAGSS